MYTIHYRKVGLPPDEFRNPHSVVLTKPDIEHSAEDAVDSKLIPDRDSLINALQLIARISDGQPLVLTNEERKADFALLVGMLDAAVDDIAQRFSTNVGAGKSQRMPMVLGYKAYVARSDGHDDALMHFFQRKLQRLAADMRTSLKLPG